MKRRRRGLVENEKQGKNKKMKSIVVEEQEQEQEEEEGSESGFADLDQDTLLNVLKRVDPVTLGRAACVNKLWRNVACSTRLWAPFIIKKLINDGNLEDIVNIRRDIRKWVDLIPTIPPAIGSEVAKPPPSDFYSIDFSKKIRPWV